MMLQSKVHDRPAKEYIVTTEEPEAVFGSAIAYLPGGLYVRSRAEITWNRVLIPTTPDLDGEWGGGQDRQGPWAVVP